MQPNDLKQGSPKQRLLLVDGDPKSLRVLDVSLTKAGFSVTTAISGAEALASVDTEMPDLVISETHIGDMDGFDLCRRIKQRAELAKIPFIFLSARKSIEDKIRGLELGVEDCLTKPVYIKEMTTRVRMLLQRQQRERLESRREGAGKFTGQLGDIGIVDLVQTIEINRKSGIVHLLNKDRRRGDIYFREGQIIDAEVGRLSGADAMFRLFSWGEGTFEVEFKAIRRKNVIELPPQALLVEGMRRLDEWTRLLETLPSLEAVFEVDYHLLAERLAEIPDEINGVLRLFDGRRTFLQVVEDCDFPDLEAATIVAKLLADKVVGEVYLESRAYTAPQIDRAAVSSRLDRWLQESPSSASASPASEGFSGVSRGRTLMGFEDGRSSSDDAQAAGNVRAPVVERGLAEAERARNLRTTASYGGMTPTPIPRDITPPVVVVPAPPSLPVPVSTPKVRVIQGTAEVAAKPAAVAAPVVVEEIKPAVVPAPAPAASPARGTVLVLKAAVDEGSDEDGDEPEHREKEVARAAKEEEHADHADDEGEEAEEAPAPPPVPVKTRTGRTTAIDTARSTGTHRATGDSLTRATGDSLTPGSHAFEHLDETTFVGDEVGAAKKRKVVLTVVAAAAVAAVILLVAVVKKPSQPAPAPEKPAEVAAAPAVAPAAVPAPPPVALPTPAPEKPAVSPEMEALKRECRAAYDSEKYADIKSACGKALEAKADAADVMIMLAHTELNRGRFAEALKWANQAIAVDPKLPEAYVFIGGAEQAAGRKTEAKAAYQKYLELAPTGKYADDLKAVVDTL